MQKNKIMADFQEDIFKEIVDEAEAERIELEKKDVLYSHCFDFHEYNAETMRDVERMFRSISAMVEFRRSGTSLAIREEDEVVQFMSADESEKLSYDETRYVLFNIKSPSYMVYYWIAEYMSKEYPRKFSTDGLSQWTREQIITTLSRYNPEVCDRQLRLHVQRLCDAREYETKMWKRISSKTIRDKKTGVMKDFMTGFHVKNSSIGLKEYSYDMPEMEAICYKQKAFGGYTKIKEQNEPNLVTKSRLVETDKNIHLIMQVVDEQPMFRRWMTLSVEKTGSYVATLLERLSGIVPSNERADLRNKFKKII